MESYLEGIDLREIQEVKIIIQENSLGFFIKIEFFFLVILFIGIDQGLFEVCFCIILELS